MTRLIALLARFAVIIAAYVAACLAASLAMHILVLPQIGLDRDQALAIVAGSLVFSVPFIALFVAYFAFVPAMVVIAVAEVFGLRGWAFHAIGGGLIGFGMAVLFANAASRRGADEGMALDLVPPDASLDDPRFVGLLVASGIVAGFVYWAIAGRLAGGWRRRAAPVTSPAP